jgi:lipoprotein-releasing system ATP-binding protein
MSSPLVYDVHDVHKEIPGPKEMVRILHGVQLQVGAAETVSIVGSSGSGKTTLLHLLAGLDVPSGGRILFQGQNLNRLSWTEKSRLRNEKIGFVFQFHHLLAEFTTLENVAMPAFISGRSRAKSLAMAREAMGVIGIASLADQKVGTLSGGERQLAALARAVVLRPEVILADEPTGNLDAVNGAKVGELLVELNESLGTTLIVVTHNTDLASSMRSRFKIQAGRIYALEPHAN